MSAIVARADALDKSYPLPEGSVAALREVSFTLERGEMVALRGPSGCGKSTLVALLACADRPTGGRLEIGGTAIGELSDRRLRALRRRSVGIVFQHFHLLDALTVRENVALPLVLLGRPRLEIAHRVATALERIGLANKAEVEPAALSGGQRQRVAIARALVHDPQLVLADEPTGNLDTTTGREIVALLREAASGGAAVLVATHAPEVAAACDRELRLRDGALEAA